MARSCRTKMPPAAAHATGRKVTPEETKLPSEILKGLLQHHNLKALILWHPVLLVQLSDPYIVAGKYPYGRSLTRPRQPDGLLLWATEAVEASKECSGMSLATLKKTLVASGYDMEKNSRINLGLKSLVSKGILVQTKGTGASGSFKFNKKASASEDKGKRKKTTAAKAKKPSGAAAKKPKKAAGAGAAKKSVKKMPKKLKKLAAMGAEKVTKSPKKPKVAKPKKVAKRLAKAKLVRPKGAKPKAAKPKKS
ncbi:histone H1.4-like [Dromiciops gliroides]|uniref:histone H1.4-like n=1 Tax=Dromiciops gliroides TaxID=33562 RepID=UPI001CC67171|nr:histone H1.4-like [Dromiciops gliroides]